MTDPAAYFDNSGRDDRLSGGVRMIPIATRKGTFNVWTKRIGNNADLKVLLLHGGPGFTHEYWEACDSFFPGAGIEYYYYDQLGSYYSDQPDEPDLWEIDRFVDEVEQVRRALRLDASNFVLMGNSWGGILAMEYAFAHQQHLKGLVIANMMASIPAYNDYARDVLMPQMDQDVLTEIKKLEENGDTDNPRYEELLFEHHYRYHVLRMPPGEWPEPVMRSFRHMNPSIYVPMQGPSELGASGKLEHWDRTNDLGQLRVPTLTIGGTHDTMDPAHMKWMAEQIPNGSYLHCLDGSHLAIYDDQETFFAGLIDWLRAL